LVSSSAVRSLPSLTSVPAESHRGETSHVLDDDSHVSQDGTALTTRDVYPMVPSQQFVR
jgi:hypothetical protein